MRRNNRGAYGTAIFLPRLVRASELTALIGIPDTGYFMVVVYSTPGKLAASGNSAALIPASFGAALVVLGLAGRAATLRPHAMHGAAAIGVLGIVGSARGIPAALRLARGEAVPRPVAAAAQATMFALCAGYVGLSLRSFIAARRTRD